MKQKADSLHKIAVYSRCIKIVLLILMIVIPCTITGMWLILDQLPESIIKKIADINEYTIGWNTKLTGLFSSIPSAVIAFAIFFYGYRLFNLYQHGQILLSENVKCFRRIGILLIANVGVGFIMKPVNTLILSMNNLPGHRLISIGLSTDEFIALGSGIFIVIIGWVMDEARKADEELQLTV